MIRIENVESFGWRHVIRGMRNPMNSWDKSDSGMKCTSITGSMCDHCDYDCADYRYVIGKNDINLMKRLAAAGTDHRKFMRMITVYADITAPLYWWKEFDTYKVGTVANSCSTMHKIADKEFTLRDFSCDHLVDEPNGWIEGEGGECDKWCSSMTLMETVIKTLNAYRYQYLKTKDKKFWWQMIQLLPSSYNQKRTVMLNYEVLRNMYHARKNHKLDEWRKLCHWIEKLPYSGLITGKEGEADG